MSKAILVALITSFVLFIVSPYDVESQTGSQARQNDHGKGDPEITAKNHFEIGMKLVVGEGVPKTIELGMIYIRSSATAGNVDAQIFMGDAYMMGSENPLGELVPTDYSEAFRWYHMAAIQGDDLGQFQVAVSYLIGKGVPKNYLYCYAWANILAASSASEELVSTAERLRHDVANRMTPEGIRQAQQLSSEWKPGRGLDSREAPSNWEETRGGSYRTGSGFYVNDTGVVITNNHVVNGCAKIEIKNAPARLLSSDAANDIAVLQSSTSSSFAAFADSNSVQLGDPVTAAGFPLKGILGSGLQITSGEVSALSGVNNDFRYYQISAPVNQGNSGGPLFDQSGRVVGMVSATLDGIETAKATGSIPQNVNFAVKSQMLETFLSLNNIQFKRTAATSRLSSAEIADTATRFTVSIICRE